MRIIHMKFQVLFTLEDNKINFRVSSAANLLSALTVNVLRKHLR